MISGAKQIVTITESQVNGNMTIDETIAHEKEVAKKQRNDNDNCEYKAEYGCKGCADYYSKPCIECAEEHEQLAEWLEDYKRIKMLIPIEQVLKAEYNKAIDDFVENISLEISESLIWGMIADCFKYKNMNDTSDKIVDYVINTANEIAEQLKAGVENE